MKKLRRALFLEKSGKVISSAPSTFKFNFFNGKLSAPTQLWKWQIHLNSCQKGIGRGWTLELNIFYGYFTPSKISILVLWELPLLKRVTVSFLLQKIYSVVIVGTYGPGWAREYFPVAMACRGGLEGQALSL